jgi:hypothetical protein
MNAPGFRRKLKDRQLTVGLDLGDRLRFTQALYGELALVDGDDCRSSAPLPHSIAYRSRNSQTRSTRLYCELS